MTKHDPLVTIQAGERDTAPLFCIPGAGASVSSFFDLSLGLPTSLPLYGLQARGLEGGLAPYDSVEEAADHYVPRIRAARPGGPYRILGHSFGGWIAFEVAQRLTTQGLAVDRLYIVDSEAPDATPSPRDIDSAIALAKLVDLYNLVLPSPIRLGLRECCALDDDAQLRELHLELVRSGLFHSRTPLEALKGVVRVFHKNVSTDYTPQFCIYTNTWLINAIDGDPEDRLAGVAGWRRFAPDAREWLVSGNHVTMLSGTHGRALSAWLTQNLTQPAAMSFISIADGGS
jgi:thioesterase domain-containing protein